MAIPTNREEFSEYVLTRLGGGSNPVVEINVSEQQVEDRIEDAIQYFREWGFDGSENVNLPHKMTASVMTMNATFDLDTIKPGMVIHGATGGNSATVVDQKLPNKLRFYLADLSLPMFVPGEAITIHNGPSFNVANTTDSIILGDFEHRYIPISDDTYSITKVFPVQMTHSSHYLFDASYHMMSDVLYSFNSTGLTSYLLTKQYLNLVSEMLSGIKPIRFNTLQNKLFVDMDWTHSIKPDDFLIIDCYKFINPTEYTKFWNNRFLKDYATVLIQLQWANNLSKFSNIQLLGGLTLNADAMRSEALAEKKELERKMMLEHSRPLGFFVG